MRQAAQALLKPVLGHTRAGSSCSRAHTSARAHLRAVAAIFGRPVKGAGLGGDCRRDRGGKSGAGGGDDRGRPREPLRREVRSSSAVLGHDKRLHLEPRLREPRRACRGRGWYRSAEHQRSHADLGVRLECGSAGVSSAGAQRSAGQEELEKQLESRDDTSFRCDSPDSERWSRQLNRRGFPRNPVGGGRKSSF